jgi:hypothetical protein
LGVGHSIKQINPGLAVIGANLGQSKGYPFPVIVCTTVGDGANAFRAVFVVDPAKDSNYPAPEMQRIEFEYEGEDVALVLQSNYTVIYAGVDVAPIRTKVKDIWTTFRPLAGLPDASNHNVYTQLAPKMQSLGVDQTKFFENTRNVVYQAMGFISVCVAEGHITTPYNVMSNDDAPDEKTITKQDVSHWDSEKIGKPTRVSGKMRDKRKSYFYLGKGKDRRKLKLPKGFVYDGMQMGLRTVNKRDHHDEGLPLYKMLEQIMARGVPAEDLPLWVTVMQEEIEKMEDLTATMRISLVALASSKTPDSK